MTTNPPPHASAPPTSNLLLEFLASHACSCPECQYDLKGAREIRCPECGAAFGLSLSTGRPRGRAFSLGLAGLAVALGFAGGPIAYGLVQTVERGKPELDLDRESIVPSLVVTPIAITALVVWMLRGRPRDHRRSATVAWAGTLVFAVVSAALVAVFGA